MEVSKLLELARIKLDDHLFGDDDEISLFKTTELIDYINNALREVVFRGGLLVKQNYTLNLINGTAEYTIEDGVINIIQMLDENKELITKIQEVDLDSNSDTWRTDTAELPYHVIQSDVNNKLLVYPIPTKDSVISFRASYFPIDEFDAIDDIPIELSELYQRDLLFWVLHEAFDRPDADTYNDKKSEDNLDKFEQTFGKKIPAERFREMMNYPDNPGSHRDW